MLRWIGNTLTSSVGRKAVMGLTGLLLVVFLVEHLYGNLHLVPIPGLGDADGTAFTAYRDELHSWGLLLKISEVGLFALFACHIVIAFRLILENRDARKQGYVVRASRGGKTPGSATMHVTGALLLAFLIKHLLDFRFDGAYGDDPWSTIRATLSTPVHGAVYVVAMLVLGLHLSHGIQSAFQSLGGNHPRWTPIVSVAGRALAALFALGFASIPLYYLIQGGN